MASRSNPTVTPAGFETFAEATKRRARKIRLLRQGNREDRTLASKLEACSKGNRCGSGACDVCLGHYRRDLVRRTTPIFAAYEHWTRASIIPAKLLKRPGELSDVDLPSVVAMIDKRFERSSLRNRIIIAGIDISLNTENNEVTGWQLHLYLLIEGENTLRVREAIKAAFPPEPTAPIPYDYDRVRDPTIVITYLFKSLFHRRSRYLKDRKPRTGHQPLKGPELRELLLFLDKYPIGARLILRGLRRDGKHLILTGPTK
jgi:hypothetical protein